MAETTKHDSGLAAGALSRRKFLRLAAIGAGAWVLAACAAPAEPTKAPAGEPTTAPATEPTIAATAAPAGSAQSGTLTVWSFEGMTDGLQAGIPAFNQKYPNIKVDIKIFGYDDVHTNLLNAIVAGAGAPDLSVFDSFHMPEYADGLTDLTDRIKPIADQFVQPSLSVASRQGKIYGLATDLQPIGSYYRKDLWDKAGLKEEEIETWEDMAAASARYDAAVGGEGHLYLITSNDIALYEVMAVEAGFGGYYFSDDDTKIIVDDPKMVAALAEMKKVWEAKGALQNPNGGYAGDEATALIKNDKIASQIVGPAWLPHSYLNSMPETAGKWRVMKAPALTKGGIRGGYQYPSLFAIPKQSQLKEPAWDLLYLGTTGDGARAFRAKSKVLPPWKPLYDELLNQGEDFFGGQKVYQLYAEISKSLPNVFFGVGFTEAEGIMSNHLQTILSGEKSIEDGLKAAAEEMRSKLNKE